VKTEPAWTTGSDVHLVTRQTQVQFAASPTGITRAVPSGTVSHTHFTHGHVPQSDGGVHDVSNNRHLTIQHCLQANKQSPIRGGNQQHVPLMREIELSSSSKT